MRCYYLLANGKIDWLSPDRTELRPAGFYAHRYVLAKNAQEAETKALTRIRSNFTTRFGDSATVDVTAEQVDRAPLWKALIPENKGHSFYASDE